ncbi:MAG: hypothetical protein OEZ08_00355 [Betaproteobacteria bacterium]|nr:hypothetical protein [Betaproteobacteria bacterium]
MRLNIVALSLTAGLFWGAAILIVGAANLAWPGYGQAFLQLIASIYPGYHPGPGFGQVLIATLYGVVDGTIGGAIFGWLYNMLAGVFSAQRT